MPCLYGNYKAKISAGQLEALKDKPDGKLILVTAISPTPTGEGKTTTSPSSWSMLWLLSVKSRVITLQEPSTFFTNQQDLNISQFLLL